MQWCAPDRDAGEGPARIGYARISTDEQNLALQLDALKASGCGRIFCDEGASGALSNRPALKDALAALRPGDVLVTWRLDRLGRSLAFLIETMSGLSRRGIGFLSLMEAIDTTTPGGTLIFHVMGALAEFERALISERTKAGMRSARARGRALGRPVKLNSDQIHLARHALDKGETLAGVAEGLGVAPLTLSRALRRPNL